MTTALTTQLGNLLDHLPLHAEEGVEREKILESTLVEKVGGDEAATVVAMVRRFFESLQLLNRFELNDGYWTFASFPASLLGRSLVSTWAAPEQTLADSGYWNDPSRTDEQRALLHSLEARRKRYAGPLPAEPIRFVHVAWGLIRVGGQFLVNVREDKERPGTKRFVLPGGKLSMADLPREKQNPIGLRALFAAKSELARQCLTTTLIREIDEELGLYCPDDYTFATAESLSPKPYVAVEGSRNNHALTHYDISVFHIQLTEQGLVKLLEKRAAEPSQNLWFSAEELAQGRRKDGAEVYVEALKEDFGDRLAEALEQVPDSAGIPYKLTKEEHSVNLPKCAAGDFVYGKNGKEKSRTIELTTLDWELLMLLGWCARNLAVTPDGNRVLLLGAGWIRLLREEDDLAAQNLIRRLTAEDLHLIDRTSNRGLRLSVEPSRLYLPTEFFTYSYARQPTGENGTITITLDRIQTCFGFLHGKKAHMGVPYNIATIIENVEAGENRLTAALREAADLERQIRDSLTSPARKIGLRPPIRTSGSASSGDMTFHMRISQRTPAHESDD